MNPEHDDAAVAHTSPAGDSTRLDGSLVAESPGASLVARQAAKELANALKLCLSERESRTDAWDKWRAAFAADHSFDPGSHVENLIAASTLLSAARSQLQFQLPQELIFTLIDLETAAEVASSALYIRTYHLADPAGTGLVDPEEMQALPAAYLKILRERAEFDAQAEIHRMVGSMKKFVHAVDRLGY